MWSLTTNYIRSTIANAQMQALMHEELADYVKNSVRLVRKALATASTSNTQIRRSKLFRPTLSPMEIVFMVASGYALPLPNL